MDAARHEFIEHTAELALRLSAPSPAALAEEACRALGALLREEAGLAGDGTPVHRTLTVESADAEALLVDVLNEVLYLAETERWAPVAVTVDAWTPTRGVFRVTGRRLAGVPSRIKSATHHGLAFTPAGRGWQAEVIFDV